MNYFPVGKKIVEMVAQGLEERLSGGILLSRNLLFYLPAMFVHLLIILHAQFTKDKRP